MKYTYLLINFFTVLFPVVLSFDKRVQFYKSWKYILPGMGITGLLFLFWDVLFTKRGVWSFSAHYITGLTFFSLPVEEILFFLTVPFACLFIYSCLNYYIKWQPGRLAGLVINTVLMFLSVYLLAANYNKLYTSVTFGLLLVLLGWTAFLSKSAWLGKFYRAYIVILIPFYIINGMLTALPIVIYNNFQNMGIRIGTIPFEDHFYCMAMMLMNIGFFEYFSRRKELRK